MTVRQTGQRTASVIERRPLQKALYSAMINPDLPMHQLSLLHADTGVGKSLVVLDAAAYWLSQGFDVLVLTASHRLIRQYVNEEIPKYGFDFDVGIYSGYSQYPSGNAINRLLTQRPFTGSERQYLQALAVSPLPIIDFVAENGPLPDGVTESMLSEPLNDAAHIKKHRENSIGKRLVFATHMAYIFDQTYRHGNFETTSNLKIVVDEADAFIDSIEQSKYQHVSLHLLHAHIKLYDRVNSKKLGNIITKLTTDSENKSKQSELVQDIFSIVNKSLRGDKLWQVEVREHYRSLLVEKSTGNMSVVFSPTRKSPQLVINRNYIPKLVYSQLSHASHVFLLSGTLCLSDTEAGFDWISNRRHVGPIAQRKIFSPDRFGEMTFSLAAACDDYPSIYRESLSGELSTDWLHRVAKDIATAAAASGENVVVLTASHSETEQLLALLPHMLGGHVPIHGHTSRSKGVNELSVDFMKEGGVFISAAAHVGLNLVKEHGGQAFSTLFITRLGLSPFDEVSQLAMSKTLMQYSSGLSEDLAHKKAKSSLYAASMVMAVRRFKQALGRALRNVDHHVHVVICDPRFPLFQHRDSKMSAFRRAIPLRFIDAYKAASEASGALPATHESMPSKKPLSALLF